MSIFNPDQWSFNHFQHCLLGDTRRTGSVIEVLPTWRVVVESLSLHHVGEARQKLKGLID